MDDMEESRKFLPPKLETVARSIRKGQDTLEKGGRLRYPRTMVKNALDCRPWVSDSEILGILQDKLSILEREKIFDGKRFDSAFDREVQTKDGDRVIYIELHKKRESHEMIPGADSEFVLKDNKEEDDKGYATMPGSKTKITNEKFLKKLREQEKEQENTEVEDKENGENEGAEVT